MKLALRAGNEKEEGESADTVGCCSLRVEHITLHEQLEGSECVVEFDFLGKDSIRYYNKVPVIKKVNKRHTGSAVILGCLDCGNVRKFNSAICPFSKDTSAGG